MSNLAQINQEIIDVTTKLAIASGEYDRATKDTYTKQTEYEVALAQAQLDADGTELTRKATAVVATAKLLREWRTARAIEKALYVRIEAMKAKLNGIQTRSNNERGEMRLAGKYD